MDCEFVGVGEEGAHCARPLRMPPTADRAATAGTEDAMARCSVVNSDGAVLFDKASAPAAARAALRC